MVCRCGDIRRYLEFSVFLQSPCMNIFFNSIQGSWSFISHTIETMCSGNCLHLGYVRSKDRWLISKETSENSKLYDACLHFTENCMHRLHCSSFRLARSVAKLSSVTPCSSSVIMYWHKAVHSVRSKFAPDCSEDTCPAVNFKKMEPRCWHQLNILQTIEQSHDVYEEPSVSQSTV